MCLFCFYPLISLLQDYIWDVELKTAITKYKEDGNKQVIPILIEPLDLGGLPGVDEDGTSIQSFEIVPKNKDERLQAISPLAKSG